jgi:hypothetical protein
MLLPERFRPHFWRPSMHPLGFVVVGPATQRANVTLSMLSSVSGSGKMSSSVSAMTHPASFWLSKHDVQREGITQEQ